MSKRLKVIICFLLCVNSSVMGGAGVTVALDYNKGLGIGLVIMAAVNIIASLVVADRVFRPRRVVYESQR